jgi:hypothetical protein
MKANELFGFYGCLHCHNWYDGRSNAAPPSWMEHIGSKETWFREMWERSMIIACDKNYL